ncbi:MAG: VanZ family protein [Phycisphaeraceae bacterium]|nr:VanZ family protein [Phycisphaeraceae bacterium]
MMPQVRRTSRTWRWICCATALAGLFGPFLLARLLAMDIGCLGISERLIRETLHFTGYGFIAVVLALALNGQVIVAGFITAMVSGAEELHQAFVPGRYCELSDWGFNIAGIAVALILLQVLLMLMSLRHRREAAAAAMR